MLIAGLGDTKTANYALTSMKVGQPTIQSTAAFMVRDSRDQNDVFKRNSSTPIADCRTFDTFGNL